MSDSVGSEFFDELRQRRAAGDSRVTPGGQAIFERITMGDLTDAFADALDQGTESDPLLSGRVDPDE